MDKNLFKESMGNMADTARKWSEEVGKALGLNRFELRKQISTFFLMLIAMGLTEKEAFNMSRSLTQLTQDMASFRNLRLEEAFTKIQAGITGETRMAMGRILGHRYHEGAGKPRNFRENACACLFQPFDGFLGARCAVGGSNAARPRNTFPFWKFFIKGMRHAARLVQIKRNAHPMFCAFFHKDRQVFKSRFISL